MSALFSLEPEPAVFLEVAVPVPLHKTFHYKVLPPLSEKARPGTRVLVPFGSKILTGVVLARVDTPEVGEDKIKPVLSVLDPEPLLLPLMLALSRWVAEYWLAPPGECLRLFFPPGMEISSVLKVRLTPVGAYLPEGVAGKLSPARQSILQAVRERGTTTVPYLQRALRDIAVHAHLAAMRQKGWVELVQETAAARVKEKKVRCLALTPEGKKLLSSADPAGEIARTSRPRQAEKQLAVLRFLSEFPPPLSESMVRKEAKATTALLKTLAHRGWVEVREHLHHRRTWQKEWHGRVSQVELTAEQRAVVESVRRAMEEGFRDPLLLHGVTGSGKTEVYVHLIRGVLASGGQALVLVPEIGLTPAALHIYRAHFGNQVALLHSGLGEGERHDEWWRVRRGEAQLVVGTRSAVFAPLERLKLIIIDEEHDSSYKQDESPRYHARDVAAWRAREQQAVLLLGSATPAVESYYQAAESKKWRLLSMSRRVQDRPLAEVEVVDMQEEFLRHGPTVVLADALKESLAECLQTGQQALVLLNRRGFSPIFLCRSCGFVLNCDHCSSPMTFHQSEQLMLCHHCRRCKEVPTICPQCRGRYIYYVGEGTEKLQAMLQKLYPGHRIDRMDADSVTRKGGYFRVLNGLLKGETDILVGTQMIAKGHDFPNVTLAAVVGADRGLSVPDFRSSERTFQLLTQVAGRSGRGEIKGKVVIQTRYPNHYSLRCACRQDYPAFFREELEYRRALAYPPFVFLAALLIRHTDLDQLKSTSEKAAQALHKVLAEMQPAGRLRIFGPNPAALEKIKSQFRYQILLKATRRDDLLRLLRKALPAWKEQGIAATGISIDLDPMSLL